MFLLLVLVSVQALSHLYATSVVEAAAYDAAQSAAADVGADVAAAEAQARSLLGALSATTEFDWSVHDDQVVLQVRAERRQMVPPPLGERLGLDVIERELRVRREEFR